MGLCARSLRTLGSRSPVWLAARPSLLSRPSPGPTSPSRALAPTRVGPEVALQQPGPGEGLAADGAEAGQRVCPDVHLEGAQAAVLLVAELAGETALGLQGAPQLPAPGQPGWRVGGPVAVEGPLGPQQAAWGLGPVCAQERGPAHGQGRQRGQVEVVQAVSEGCAEGPAGPGVRPADVQGFWP